MKKILLCLLLSTLTTKPFFDCDPKFYMTFDSGISFAMQPSFCIPDKHWSDVQEGYNSSLGSSILYGLEAGADLNDWLSMGTGFTYRGPYNYCKYQTPIDGNPPHVRYFDLENISFMYNVFFNRTQNPRWCYDVCCFTLAPYLGFGIGASRNNLYNFYTYLENRPEKENIKSVMTPYIEKSFAAQFMAGVEADYNEHLSLAAGYRFFYGGNIVTNNYNIDADKIFRVSPWQGKLKANELVFSLHVTF